MSVMTRRQRATLLPLMRKGCTGLFETHGIPAQEAPLLAGLPAAEARGVIASLRFTGERIRGAAMLLAPEALLLRLCPVLAPGSAERDIRDWLGEMSNQLVGRLKSQVLPLGVGFDLGTPVCVLHEDIFRLARTAGPSELLVFQAGGDPIAVLFDVEIAPDAELSLPPGPPEDQPDEGDLLLF